MKVVTSPTPAPSLSCQGTPTHPARIQCNSSEWYTHHRQGCVAASGQSWPGIDPALAINGLPPVLESYFTVTFMIEAWVVCLYRPYCRAQDWARQLVHLAQYCPHWEVVALQGFCPIKNTQGLSLFTSTWKSNVALSNDKNGMANICLQFLASAENSSSFEFLY